MGGDLSGVRLKLDRADQHLVTVDAELSVFRQVHPYRLVRETNADGTEDIWYAYDLRHPPDRLSIFVGEFLYSLRSALDHLVWQLVLSNNASPSQRNAFPIFSSNGKYHAMDGGNPARGSGLEKVAGVGPTPQAVIEGLQPYHHGATVAVVAIRDQTIKRHPLNVLDDFCNIDKHRLLHVVRGNLTAANFGYVDLQGTGVPIESHVAYGPLDEGAKVQIARFVFDRPYPDEVKVHFSPSIEDTLDKEWEYLFPIAGAPPESVTRRLDIMRTAVHDAITALSEYVEP